MAICDARYVFRLVDIGSYRSNNDSGVFRNSTMRKGFFERRMNLPDPEVISSDCFRKELSHYNRGFYGLILEKNISEDDAIFNSHLSWVRLLSRTLSVY